MAAGVPVPARGYMRAAGLRAAALLLALGVVVLAAQLAPGTAYGPVGDALVWFGWLAGVTLVALAAAEAFELIELAAPGQCDGEPGPVRASWRPFVSLHVPICAEPPEVVERTLRALAALRYERFEVLVIDNNTADAALWRPIEQLCQQLGPPFRFFHLPRWPGYKAGALNFALARTCPDATVVGVIDSDYVVAPDFLESLAGHFAGEDVGFVQAPQDYRDWQGRWFSRMCYWEYWQFFAVSMRLRRRRNAILMHGTMVMVRKAALLRVGGWSEWCLTEDSELGLRLLAAGYRGLYSSTTHGRGLVPFCHDAYRRQRRRWVTGGVQTLRRHWRLFLPWDASLTAAQKMHYLQGWAPWLRDAVLVGCAPVVAVLAAFSLGFANTPEPVLPLTSAVLAVVLYLAVRQIIVYRAHLRRPWADGVSAGAAIFGLVMPVGRAWLRGWLGYCPGFQRTPKRPQPEDGGLRTQGELLVGVGMIVLGFGLLLRFGLDAAGAAAGLAAYSAPFLASVWVDLVDRDGI